MGQGTKPKSARNKRLIDDYNLGELTLDRLSKKYKITRQRVEAILDANHVVRNRRKTPDSVL